MGSRSSAFSPFLARSSAVSQAEALKRASLANAKSRFRPGARSSAISAASRGEGASAARRVEGRHAAAPPGEAQDPGGEVLLERRLAHMVAPAAAKERFAA